GALSVLGQAAMMEDDLERARAHFEESLSFNRSLPTPCYMGIVAFEQGRFDEAREYLQEFLVLARDPFDARLVANALDAFGGLAAAKGQPVRAFQLAGAAESLRARWRVQPRAWFRERLDRARQRAADGLDEATLDNAWMAGQRLTPDDAIDYALRPE